VEGTSNSTRAGSTPEEVDGVPVLTVSRLARFLKQHMGSLFPDGIWLEGEIEGMKPKPHPTGHYFSLVDGEGKGKRSISAKLFSRNGTMDRVLKTMDDIGSPLKSGMRVRVLCRLDYYDVRGELGVIIDRIDPQFTLGLLAAKRDKLIADLMAKGLHKRNGRCAVPLVPLRVGVVTSLQAAGWADAQRHLEESGFGFNLLVADVNVQGDLAPAQVAAAIRTLDGRDDLDVLIVVRGGGSKGDLAAFDDERVAMAIVGCRHAVFTGIGHQIDTSVADIVAHSNLKTPTAVADELIRRVQLFRGRLARSAGILGDRTLGAVAHSRLRLSRTAQSLRHRPEMILASARHRTEIAFTQVRLLDPASSLARGWSITHTADGRLLRTVADARSGEKLVTTVADGTITSTVD
jgi:exodeoxyribonuclease VII large subunit